MSDSSFLFLSFNFHCYFISNLITELLTEDDLQQENDFWLLDLSYDLNSNDFIFILLILLSINDCSSEGRIFG